jgi:hypothetical protein
MKYLKLFESKKSGWSKEKVKIELLSNCDSEVKKLQKKLDRLIQLKENLDSEFSELDFFVRANFSELPGFSHYFYGSPDHSDDFVKCRLEVRFNTSEMNEKELRLVVKDFLNDCKRLKSIVVDDEYDSVYAGFDWDEDTHYNYITYLSTPIKRIEN